jgi:hypothetical protein
MEKSQKVRIVQVKRHLSLEPKTCPQCGKAFMGAKVAKFCSRACTRAASYQRHAEERREHRRQTYAQAKGKAGRGTVRRGSKPR